MHLLSEVYCTAQAYYKYSTAGYSTATRCPYSMYTVIGLTLSRWVTLHFQTSAVDALSTLVPLRPVDFNGPYSIHCIAADVKINTWFYVDRKLWTPSAIRSQLTITLSMSFLWLRLSKGKYIPSLSNYAKNLDLQSQHVCHYCEVAYHGCMQ